MSTLSGGPHGTTETGAAHMEAAFMSRNQDGYTEAGRRARARADANAAARAEANHPDRLLGVAQAAIRDALLMNSVPEIHNHLAEVLGRIHPEVTA